MDIKNGKRIGYIRVSSTDQCTDRQLDGLTLDKTFVDRCSGKDTERPQLTAMLDYVREGDVILVHSMDRLARNLSDLLKLVRQLTGQGITIEFAKEHLTFTGDSSNALNNIMLSILGGVAEFERSQIRERQAEGIIKAKAKGAYTGRKQALTYAQVAGLRDRLKEGAKVAELARELNIGRATVYRYLQDQALKLAA